MAKILILDKNDELLRDGIMEYPSGCLNYKHSEVVKGDVKTGTNITCGGDLWIDGVIEDCKVSVKGDLFCGRGFTGTGGGVVVAAGDVNLGRVENQTVISLGGVNIAEDALNSSVMARRSITASCAVGGTLSANKTISVKTVGNAGGVKTILQINPDADSIKELVKSEADIKQREADMRKLIRSLDTLTRAQRDDKAFMRKIRNALITLKYQITTIEARTREINIAMSKFEDSFIHIEQCVYPGTVVRFGQNNMTLADTMKGGTTLRMVDSQIRIL
jgi:uncharacterized protein (DUF342 family)